MFKSGIDRWLYLLARGEDLDPDSTRLAIVEPDIGEALEITSVFTKQDRARYTYEKRLDYQRWLKGSLKAERAEGLAEGTGPSREEVEGS
jgi:hypothetical protein